MPGIGDILANLVKNVTDYGLEKVFQRYYSVYRGQVIDNSDPDRRGRVKVKVPTLFGDEALPHYAEPRDFRGAGAKKGEYWPPEVDDWVFVEFEMGDTRYPLYSGGWHGTDEVDADSFEHEDGVPQARGMQTKYGHVMKFVDAAGKERMFFSTPKGHYLILDDTDGAEAIFLIHKTGAQMQIDAAGSVKVVALDGGYVSLNAETGEVSAASKDGSLVKIASDIVLLPKGGDSMLRLAEGIAQLTSAKDIIVAGNSVTVSGGSVVVDAQGAKLNLGSGKVALGAGPCELVDTIIQYMDALLTSPSLCTTGTGPSGPLSPPAAVQIAALKALLTAIKGSL